MFCDTFGLNCSIGLVNDNEMSTTHTCNNEVENYRYKLSFKQKRSLASTDELKFNNIINTLFTFKIIFIYFIDHTNT